jgi:hypothetical protein
MFAGMAIWPDKYIGPQVSLAKRGSRSLLELLCVARRRKPPAALQGAQVLLIPLEELRAEAALSLHKFQLVAVVSAEAVQADAETRVWQACVRLRRVYGLEQAIALVL